MIVVDEESYEDVEIDGRGWILLLEQVIFSLFHVLLRERDYLLDKLILPFF